MPERMEIVITADARRAVVGEPLLRGLQEQGEDESQDAEDAGRVEVDHPADPSGC